MDFLNGWSKEGVSPKHRPNKGMGFYRVGEAEEETISDLLNGEERDCAVHKMKDA